MIIGMGTAAIRMSYEQCMESCAAAPTADAASACAKLCEKLPIEMISEPFPSVNKSTLIIGVVLLALVFMFRR